MLSDIRLYERLCRGEEPTVGQRDSCRLTRDDVGMIYRFLKRQNGFSGDLEALLSCIEHISYIRLRLALDVMSELSLIKCVFSGDSVNIQLCPVEGKLELDRAPTFSRVNR